MTARHYFTTAQGFAQEFVPGVVEDYHSHQTFGASQGRSLRDYWHFCNDSLQARVLDKIMGTLRSLPPEEMGAILGSLAFCARGGRYDFNYQGTSPVPINPKNGTVSTGGISRTTLAIAQKVHDDWDGPSKLVLLAMKAVLSELYELVEERLSRTPPTKQTEDILGLSIL